MTPDPLALHAWLQAYAVTHVALESTGVYWKPVYYVLEDAYTLLLINMHQLRHVPGRKTDVQDSEWLAQLLECGLLRGSLVPPPTIRELRDITRYRVQQLRDRSQEVNRLCKVLEDAGLKLSSAASDVVGASGRAMITALIQGTTDPAVLADLARGRLRQKLPALRAALHGRFRPVHAFLLEQILAKIDFLDETLGRITEELESVGPFRAGADAAGHDPGLIASARSPCWRKRAGTCPGSRRPATCVVGPRCARPRRNRGQATERPDPRRPPLSARDADPGGDGGWEVAVVGHGRTEDGRPLLVGHRCTEDGRPVSWPGSLQTSVTQPRHSGTSSPTPTTCQVAY